ncbi:DNA primase [Candidatus Uhrbacteria bacterium CG_4_9_14_3_um_filter_36_7]|uniref:DNA primase n=1 Tax=Candidatus Uhrbacteria bacterium CG_4_9_14_3_um_filter_36_7 TaxID=1975033 RepID=A0A2M7XH18_9BACT|nr:MAG: DNA primase [Candidatus Uhrbacteria bacterium CG_4_9_14_3_um_filter_36_7]
MEPKDEIKAKLDIVDVISEYLPLKQAGSASFKAPCPFHQEKTPSFQVSREKQIWHCFGCGEGGDIFSFVMKIEGIDFSESLRLLGKKAGVEINRFTSAKTNERQQLLIINRLACDFFQIVLTKSHQALVAREYVERRGITEELSSFFKLGYAPKTWDTLVQFFEKKKIPLKSVEQAGLIVPRKEKSGFIDRFRNRLMIPLFDIHGNTIGFTGRSLDNDQGPKYMNSPESLIYHKGEILFGLNLAKYAIREKGCVILVEGNMDVIASHKAGVMHVVASSGTALTQTQLILLKRFTKRLLFCFDQDAAGFIAAKRGIHLAKQLDMDVEVISIPSYLGKDPDDIVQKDPSKWIELIKHPIPVMEYMIEQSLQNRDQQKIDDKLAISRLLIPELCLLTNVVEREHWLLRVANLLEVPVDELRASCKTKADSPLSFPIPQTLKNNFDVKFKKTKIDRASEIIFSLLLNSPIFLKDDFLRIPSQWFVGEFWQEIGKFSRLWYDSFDWSSAQVTFVNWMCEQARQSSLADFESSIRALALFGETLISSSQQSQARESFIQAVSILEDAALQREQQSLTKSIRAAEQEGNQEKVKALLQQYQNLVQKLSSQKK